MRDERASAEGATPDAAAACGLLRGLLRVAWAEPNLQHGDVPERIDHDVSVR